MTDEDKSDKNYSYSPDVSVESQEAPRGGPEYDAVFGEYKEGQVHYKSVGWQVEPSCHTITLLISLGLKPRLSC